MTRVEIPDPAVCCSTGTASCCSSQEENKNIQLDFLYLDLESCSRCNTASEELIEAARELESVLDALGYSLAIEKIEVSSPEIAEQYHFISSPTIRVNGRDINLYVKENNCADCGDLCGSDVDCRVFEYSGNEYDSPPKAMIVDAVLRALYQPAACSCEDYVMPDNLKTFFEGKSSSYSEKPMYRS